MFPKTKNLTAQRTGTAGLDREAWLEDIRNADAILDDDPLNSRG